jgi:hypothetical protein
MRASLVYADKHRMAATSMSKDIMTWQEIGEAICGNPLSAKAEMLKIELCNFIKKGENADLSDSDIAILLLVIGESMLSGVDL